jgi:hypothetical protein
VSAPSLTGLPLRSLPVPPEVQALNPYSKGLRCFYLGECSVFVCREPAGADGGLLWHLSIAHRDRYPTWDEIHDARYRLVPDAVTMAMLLPPPDEYVNVHPNCFHIWESHDLRRPALWVP